MFGLANLAAGPDPSTMPCIDIIGGYEKNLLMSTPEGGRSAKHQKNSRTRVDELQPYYDKCVAGSAGGGEPDMDTQALIDKIYDPDQLSSPLVRQQPLVSSGIGMGPMIALGVIAALGVAYFLTKSKGKKS